ncbi:K02A2.6-like [Cordylochernes scorpioides]|uniref:RNA-directed DNA polymerase n=1 Tax=Cordylochernes scorpioides TaxID=51811 RepID=A0ABY6K2W8_9ARAC|nr:K02A2.6-like [Cordylochernes scorpioides]
MKERNLRRCRGGKQGQFGHMCSSSRIDEDGAVKKEESYFSVYHYSSQFILSYLIPKLRALPYPTRNGKSSCTACGGPPDIRHRYTECAVKKPFIDNAIEECRNVDPLYRFTLSKFIFDKEKIELRRILNRTKYDIYKFFINVAYYTDGSKTRDGVGAGVYRFSCLDCAPEIRESHVLSPHCSVFQAEALGLVKALENATTLPNHLTLGFFLDNLSVVKSVLNSKTGNYLIDRALLLISRLNRNGNRCTIQWIKGHSGNVGNDIADTLAKRGAESADPSCYKLAPLSFVKSAIYGRAREAWESRFLSLAPSIHTRFGLTPMSFLDKRYAYIVPSDHIVVGLLMGHTWTDSFAHRIGVIDDPSCPYCDADREETLSHIVLECSSLDALRFPLLSTCAEELGYTPRSLKDFIFNRSTWRACLEFLKASDRLKPRVRAEDSDHLSDSDSSPHDSALEWYADEIISNPAIKRWEVVKEKLIQRFGSYNANPIVSASHRRLKREESIENYFQDKIRLLNQTHLTKEEKNHLLTDGLPNDWKDLIVAAQPTDATKWFHIAASIEQNRASIQFKPKNKIHLATKNNDNRKNVCPFWCPICSKKGIKIKHWVTDCEDYDPNYKKDRSNQNTSVKQVCGAPELLNVSTLTNTPTQGAFKLINISVEVNGIPAQAFVDTGATVSIINWRLFKRTRLQLQPNSDIHIRQADGVTRTCGSLQTKVRIDKLIKPVTLHVMKNFKYPLLIGLDVASLFNLLIDVRDKTIYTKFDGLQNPILVNHLEEIREHELKELLEHNRNVFCQHAIDLGKVAIQHKIITKSEQPISLRPYRRPLKEYEGIAEQVKELLEHKLIRISYSPWAFPVVMVPKKDGNKRMCIDYRRLNEITLDDRQPLPHIQDMFDRLHGSRFFSTLDVAWGYWQIEMDPQSIQKTAFVTNDGHYEFLVMPFGLKNAASTFQRIIQHILGELLWKGTCSFQDDILVYTKTWQEHIELLSKVFDKLRQYNMKLKLSKCIFGRTEVKYLGHIISHNQLKPDPGKVKSIQDFPRPDTVKKVRQFMGLANYYRKFVKDFSKISFPLVRLTRKNQPFFWNEEVEESFAKLKMALSTKPVLAIYNPDYPSKVYTDASKYGIGAILTQIGPDNEEHVIAYYSKTLQPHQENYSAYEMECLAVIQATDHFHVYIENQPFEIITDHAALQWLFTMKKPKPKYFRWILSLSSKSCNIVHRSGKQQTHVDALSRLPVVNIATQELQEHQQNSDLSFLKNSHTHDGVVMIKQKGVFKAVVPNSLTKKILEEYHDSLSHPSITKTCKLITQYYWWKGITTDIKNYVRSCKSCQLVKVRHEPTLGEMITPTSNIQPLQMIGCDTIVLGTAAANTKHKFIQVFVDHATRYLWAYPTITNTAQAVTQCLDKIIKSVNSINTILTDNGKNFISKEFNKFLSLQGIKHTYTSPYRPQCNGICEKLNDTIMTKLRIAVLEKPRCKWSSLLPQVVKNYNSTPHDVTGFSPLFLMYGIGNVPEFADQTPITIEEARKKASLRTEQSRSKWKIKHDSHHPKYVFKEGDLVIRKIAFNDPRLIKTSPKYEGPFVIQKKISDVTYDISLKDQKQARRVESFSTFFERLEQFLILEDPSEDKKKAYLLTLIGAKAYEVLKNLCSPELPKNKTFEELTEKLNTHFSPKRSIIVQQFIFFKRMQETEESVSQYLVAIKRLAATCEFGNFLVDSLRDKFVCGLSDSRIQKKILSEGDVSLARVMEIALSMEAAEQNIKLFHAGELEKSVDKLRTEMQRESKNGKRKCKHCGNLHRDSCRFKDAVCFKCRKKGHIAPVCRNHEVYPIREQASQQNRIHQMDDHGETEELIQKITCMRTPHDYRINTTTSDPPYTIRLKVEKNFIDFELDTGSCLTLISENDFEKYLPNAQLKTIGMIIKTYDGTVVPILGEVIVKIPSEISIAEFLKEHQVLFNDTAEPIKGFTFSMNIRDVSPIFHKARPVPFAIRTAVTEALENKVTLNRFLDTADYPLPTQQDLFAILAKGKYFSKLDLSSAYLQLEVATSTQPFLTINTHKGLFRFRRMPFGLANAPSYFQSVMDRVLAGIEGVICYIDYVLIATVSVEKHLAVLKTVFLRLEKYNIKLKKDKCEDGIRPLDHKVQALQKAKSPTNISELRSFLGLVNYYGKFIPNLPDLLRPLHELLHKKNCWSWTKECEEAIEKCKSKITSERVLVPYDTTLPLFLATDASQIGIGAVLSHVIGGQERRSYHGNADLLSRLPVESGETSRLDNIYALSYMEDLPITAEEIRIKTQKDEVLSIVKCYTQHGWPERVPDHLRPYFQRKLELTVDGECLLWGMRVIIPSSLRPNLLSCLHETHSGMSKMKSVARSHFWWPNLDNEIEFLVNRCRNCQQVQDGPNRVKWQPWIWAVRPWQRIHIDYANKDNINLLIVVDSHSKWIEAFPMREITSANTIEQLRRLFSSYGLPEEIVSDNGPQFTGSDMKTFLKNNGIKQTLIPAYHPQSNGLAERAVKMIKMALDKNKRKPGDTIQDTLSKILLAYRSTPHETTKKAPSELFIGRSLRTRLSIIHPNLESRVKEQQARQMKYDHGFQQDEFGIYDMVWCRNFRGGDRWIPGRIVGRKGSRVYTVLIHGQVKSYHRDQIRKRWENGGDEDRQYGRQREETDIIVPEADMPNRGRSESPPIETARQQRDSGLVDQNDGGISGESSRSPDPEASNEGPIPRRNPPRNRRPPSRYI